MRNWVALRLLDMGMAIAGLGDRLYREQRTAAQAQWEDHGNYDWMPESTTIEGVTYHKGDC